MIVNQNPCLYYFINHNIGTVSKFISKNLYPVMNRTHGIFRLTTPGGMSVIRKCQQRGFHSHDQPPDGGPIYKTCTDVYMDPKLKFDIIDLR